MEFTGKTIDEAIANGLTELKLEEKEADIKVICDSVKGLFGKYKTLATVEIVKIMSNSERVIKFLQDIFNIVDINAKAELVEDGDKIIINIITDSSASVIGYRGEVLDSLQSLAGAVANTGNKVYKRVVVDCEGYRAKREDTLVSLAGKLADKAARTGRNVLLEPMSPYERRIIHSALAESATVTTTSEGKEPNRFVVIIPNEKKSFGRNYDKRSDGRPNRRFDGKPDYKRDGSSGSGGDRRNGGYRNQSSGFTSLGGEKRKKPAGFGTYLGNSLKTESVEKTASAAENADTSAAAENTEN